MALDAAPRLSASYTRALVMKAVFFEHGRVQNVSAVLAALPKDKGEKNHAANFLDSSLPVSVRDEISVAVRCAMIAAIVTSRSAGETSLPASFTIHKAISWFNQLPIDPVELSLLGFSAVYHLLHLLASDVDYIASSDSSASSSPVSEAGSSADDEAEEKPRSVGRKIAICPRDIPNLGRVAAELIYWARNAYNPAFYGFSSSLVDIIVKSCTTVCSEAGINVDDYLQVVPEPLPSRRRRHRRRQGGSQQSIHSDVDHDVKDPRIGKPLQRERSASNDTGYGSLSLEEEIQSAPKVPEKVPECST
jgi:hypothetical protein